jgi:hypothetical protein
MGRVRSKKVSENNIVIKVIKYKMAMSNNNNNNKGMGFV